jgi:hypothetical protein
MPAVHRDNPVCPRNLSNLSRWLVDCQPVVPTGFPPDLHSGEQLAVRGQQCPRHSLLARDRMHLPPKRPRRFRRTPRRKNSNLGKDHLEVLATNAKTLRGTLSPNVNSVAGVDFQRYFSLCNFRCRTSDESCGINRPASHTLLSTYSFIPDGPWSTQGGVYSTEYRPSGQAQRCTCADAASRAGRTQTLRARACPAKSMGRQSCRISEIPT